MNLNTEHKQNNLTHPRTSRNTHQAFFAKTRRKSSELSPSELRGIVIEILG